MDNNLLTNAELQSKCAQLEKLYKEAQMDMKEAYEKMVQFSEEYTELRNILNKREGKITTNEQ
jgi:hypothetical protein